MTGWEIFIVGCVCAAGALLFLRIAAVEIEGGQNRLWMLESGLRHEWERRQADGDTDEPITLVPLGKNGPTS